MIVAVLETRISDILFETRSSKGLFCIIEPIKFNASNGKLTITATDLDIIFINEINNVEIIEEGKTTTSSSVIYDIIRKIPSGNKINFSTSTVRNYMMKIMIL